MSDPNVFARFIYEMRTLLTAIESHTVSLSAGSPDERRPHALSEVARLSHAAAALAQAFEVDDLRTLADALAQAADSAAQADEADPFAPLGARDTLSYMKWRVERLAAAGRSEPPSEREQTLAHRLGQTLRPRSSDQEQPAFTGPSGLTLDELTLVRSFPSAQLRRRDAQADARVVARVTGAPAFTAQTVSGASIPVFGGMADDDDPDEVPPEMKRLFVKETQADVRDITQHMLDFEQRQDKAQALANMEFIGHKIKGSASLMRFEGFSDIASVFEETMKAGQRGRSVTDESYLVGLGRFLNIFERALEIAARLEDPGSALIEEARALQAELTQAEGARAASVGGNVAAMPPTGSRVGSEARPGERPRLSDGDLVLRIEASKLDMLMNQLSALAANRGAVARNRVEIARAQAEMQVALARLREKSAHITDAHPLTYDNLLSASRLNGASLAAGATGAASADSAPTAQPTTSGALRASWSSLELEQYTEVDTALRALAEVVTDVTVNYGTLADLLDRLSQLTETQEALTRDIQEDAMDIRLARLGEITPRLVISARIAASDLGKLVDFVVRGDEIEIDRSLLEALEGPLIQLVRNSIAHGIETPAERQELGKPPTGKVWAHAYNMGAAVVIEVGDDGRGVNANLLVGAAMGAQIITSEDARGLTQEQALSFMFHPGVTTSGVTAAGYVGALAGSGIGLADVAHTIRTLKGSITVQSDVNKGTTFQIRVPISLSMQPVLEVSAGGQVFALPFALVQSTAIVTEERLRVQASEHPGAGGHVRSWRATVDMPLPLDTPDPLFSGEENLALAETDDGGNPFRVSGVRQMEVPAYALAELLGFEQDAAALKRLVVTQHRGETVALLVEAVGDADAREATVRPLPRRLQRSVVRGVVVRPEDGEVALLIDPQEALSQRLAGVEIMLRPASPPAEPRLPSPSVLIVDDSVTIRRTLEQVLTTAGFTTRQAHDGYEALEMMENELPRVVILDVEMPRLSGFELLTIMRSSPQYQQVRVAMLTSRAADKHRDYALTLGADAYLVKPCPQETLVETIRRLLTESESG